MHALLRGTAVTVGAVAGLLSCSSTARESAAHREYVWALSHGACECGPIAYASGRATPSLISGQSIAGYVRDKTTTCSSRQFVVVAFGDGAEEITRDLTLAQKRAKSFVRYLREARYRRLDTLAFGGPHIAHPSTVEILCPSDRLPAQAMF